MKTILIIDDNEIDTLINRKALERINPRHEIHSALNGKIAIALLNNLFLKTNKLPDVILLDLDMPIMDGFTFIRKFKDLPLPGKEKVTMVVLTSSSNPSDVQSAEEIGIDLFLTKPLSEEKILKTLNPV
jgi:CheY-like chemotaxis protein